MRKQQQRLIERLLRASETMVQGGLSETLAVAAIVAVPAIGTRNVCTDHISTLLIEKTVRAAHCMFPQITPKPPTERNKPGLPFGILAVLWRN